jgi:hypothetical protein
MKFSIKFKAVSLLKFLIERNLVPSKEKLIEKQESVKKICKNKIDCVDYDEKFDGFVKSPEINDLFANAQSK